MSCWQEGFLVELVQEAVHFSINCCSRNLQSMSAFFTVELKVVGWASKFGEAFDRARHKLKSKILYFSLIVLQFMFNFFCYDSFCVVTAAESSVLQRIEKRLGV